MIHSIVMLSRLTGWGLAEVDGLPMDEFDDALAAATAIARAEGQSITQLLGGRN
jgi:hypothetical protein